MCCARGCDGAHPSSANRRRCSQQVPLKGRGRPACRSGSSSLLMRSRSGAHALVQTCWSRNRRSPTTRRSALARGRRATWASVVALRARAALGPGPCGTRTGAPGTWTSHRPPRSRRRSTRRGAGAAQRCRAPREAQRRNRRRGGAGERWPSARTQPVSPPPERTVQTRPARGTCAVCSFSLVRRPGSKCATSLKVALRQYRCCALISASYTAQDPLHSAATSPLSLAGESKNSSVYSTGPRTCAHLCERRLVQRPPAPSHALALPSLATRHVQAARATCNFRPNSLPHASPHVRARTAPVCVPRPSESTIRAS